MKFISKYDIEYKDHNGKTHKIDKWTLVDIVKVYHSERIGTRYELDNGQQIPASAFNAGFEEYTGE